MTRMLEFYSPFLKRIHPSAERAQIESMQWMRSHDLLEWVSNPVRFAADRYSLLAALMFPDAGDDLLQLVADWTHWLFVLDDIFDESSVGQSPLKTRTFVDRTTSVLYRENEPNDAISTALSDLCTRFAALGGQLAYARFAAHTVEYFEACIWEAENRAARLTPPLAIFEIMRSYAGAVRTYLDFAEVAAGIALPALVRQHAAIQRANQAACNIACWNNDALSFMREERHGDSHNLVLVLSSECGLPMDLAVAAAVAACDAEVRILERIVRDLPSFGSPVADAAAGAYTRALTDLVRGAIDWSSETARYREAGRAA